MEDIFDANECAALLARVAKVRGDQKPLWGKMSAAQMFAHCQAPLEVALGDKKLKRSLIGFLFGGIAATPTPPAEAVRPQPADRARVPRARRA
jgi:hypothetical protein